MDIQRGWLIVDQQNGLPKLRRTSDITNFWNITNTCHAFSGLRLHVRCKFFQVHSSWRALQLLALGRNAYHSHC